VFVAGDGSGRDLTYAAIPITRTAAPTSVKPAVNTRDVRIRFTGTLRVDERFA
jgi:hypothetical protein